MESHNSGTWTNLMGFAGLVLDWRPDSGDCEPSTRIFPLRNGLRVVALRDQRSHIWLLEKPEV